MAVTQNPPAGGCQSSSQKIDLTLRPFTAGTFRVKDFVQEHNLANRGAMYEHLRVVPPGKRLRVPSCPRPEILGSG
jgi:hypothetical protein